jgi:hypothetical protein
VHFAHAKHDVLVTAHGHRALHASGRIELGSHQARDAAQRLAPAHDRGDALLVDAVLERDDEAVGREIRLHEMRSPLGVVGFHADEGDVDRRLLHETLYVRDVQSAHLHRTAFGFGHAGELEPVPAHVLDVLGPRIDQRDIVTGTGHVTARITADRTGAHYDDTLAQSLSFPKLSKSVAREPLTCQRPALRFAAASR